MNSSANKMLAIEPNTATLFEIKQLCDKGLFQTALSQLGSPENWRKWTNVSALIAASRLANHLGNDRYSTLLSYQVFRIAPLQAEVQLDYLRTRLSRQGVYAAWQYARTENLSATASELVSSEWYSLLAYLNVRLRDFKYANELFDKAITLAPDNAWLFVERSYSLESMDRHDEAIAACLKALDITPDYRSAVQRLAYLFAQQGDLPRAVTLLENFKGLAESGSAWIQLSLLHLEQRNFAQARHCLDKARPLFPLATQKKQESFAAIAVDIACAEQKHAEVPALCSAMKNEFYQKIAERLAAADHSAERIVLDVPYVKQHHMTCAPATLSAISKYWNKSAEHLHIAEQICYDGTPHYSQRIWAQQNGWLDIEFTVTWQNACALIRQGFPFALTTVHALGSHLQAIIGFDSTRGTLISRDPDHHAETEIIAERFFATHQSSGPRGLLLIPLDKKDSVDHSLLNDSALWDFYHQLAAALSTHQRDTALAALEQLRELAPAHRLRWTAEKCLADYDGDEAQVLFCLNKLLQDCPNDRFLISNKARTTGILTGKTLELEWLLTHQDRDEPILNSRTAHLLLEDSRQHAKARTLLKHNLKRYPSHGASWWTMAELYAMQKQNEAALTVYRVACCLLEDDESAAGSYMDAAQQLSREDEVLEFLGERFERLKHRSAQPAIVLINQLGKIEKTQEALAVLAEAQRVRPNDGDLFLFATEYYWRLNMIAEADAALAVAKTFAKKANCRYLEAQHAQRNGQFEACIQLGNEVIAIDPLHIGAHRLIATAISRSQDNIAAIDFMRSRCRAFPNCFRLQEILLEFLDLHNLQDYIDELKKAKELHPHNLWVKRELALSLASQRDFDAASALMADVKLQQENNTFNHSVHASIYLKKGDIVSAKSELKQAITCSVDNDYAVDRLLELSHSQSEVKDNLTFVIDALKSQANTGNSIISIQSALNDKLDAQELLAALHTMRCERPQNWQSWVAEILQLRAMDKAGETLPLLDEAIKLFALLPRVWLERYHSYRQLNQIDEAFASLEKVLDINPSWTRALDEYLEMCTRHKRSTQTLLHHAQRALHQKPNEVGLLALMAQILVVENRSPEAIDFFERALKIDPSPQWIWREYRQQVDSGDSSERFTNFSNSLRQMYGGHAEFHCRLAEHETDLEQKHQLLSEAIRLSPLWTYPRRQQIDLYFDNRDFANAEKCLDQVTWPILPFEIALFRPRLLWEKGQLDNAVHSLEALLKAEPMHYIGWRFLADWYEKIDHIKGQLHASQKLVELAPAYAIANGYLADALLRDGQRENAMTYFAKAFQLDAEYHFAGTHCFDYHFNRAEFELAGDFLAKLKQAKSVSVQTLQRSIAYSVKTKNTDSLKDDFAAFFRHRDLTIAQMDDIWSQLKDKSEKDQMLASLSDNVASGKGQLETVFMWFNLSHQSKKLPEIEQIINTLLDQHQQPVYLQGVLRWMAQSESRLKLLPALITRFNGMWQNDNDTWGQVGYVWLAFDRYHKVIECQADWQQREAPAWALDNLAMAYRCVGDHKNAALVSQRSIDLQPTNDEAHIWLAADAAVARDMHKLQSHLCGVVVEDQREFYRGIAFLLAGFQEAWLQQDSSIAVPLFAKANADFARNSPMTYFAGVRFSVIYQLLRYYTPWWKVPWRWLQLSYFR